MVETSVFWKKKISMQVQSMQLPKLLKWPSEISGRTSWEPDVTVQIWHKIFVLFFFFKYKFPLKAAEKMWNYVQAYCTTCLEPLLQRWVLTIVIKTQEKKIIWKKFVLHIFSHLIKDVKMCINNFRRLS